MTAPVHRAASSAEKTDLPEKKAAKTTDTDTKVHQTKKRALDTDEPETPAQDAKTQKKKVTPLKPTTDEPWTEVAVGYIASKTLQFTIKPLLAATIKEKLSSASWKKIEALDISNVKKTGEIEKLVLTMIEETVPDDQIKREALHEKLKECLKLYAEKGLTSALPKFKELLGDT